jgi:AcrR family transcriptional regulator
MTTHTRRHHERPDREARHAAKRQQLLDAAIAVVRRDGPGASMQDIAREAGITKPIVYRAFGDREGLLQAIADRFADELAETLRAELDQPDRGYREAVAGTIGAYLAFIERDPAIVRILVNRDLAGLDATAASTPPLIRRMANLVTQSIGEQLRALALDAGAAEPWGYAIVGAVHLAGDWWLEHTAMTREQLVEYLTQLVWDGMRNYGSEGERS